MELGEMGHDSVQWTHLAENSKVWWAFVSTVMNIPFLIEKYFFINNIIVRLRQTPFQGATCTVTTALTVHYKKRTGNEFKSATYRL
jgi:hypothetical protein